MTGFLNDPLWQGIVSGFVKGTKSVIGGLIDKSETDKVKQEFADSTKALQQGYQQIVDKQNSILNGDAIQQEAPTKEELYANIFKPNSKLLTERGKPYRQALEDTYKNMFKNPDNQIIEQADGSKVLVDKNTGQVLKTITPPTAPKEDKTISIAKFKQMTVDDVEKLTDIDATRGMEYFSDDVRTELFKRYPALEDEYNYKHHLGVYAKDETSGNSRHSSRGTVDESLQPNYREKKIITDALVDIGKDLKFGGNDATVAEKKKQLMETYGWDEAYINSLATDAFNSPAKETKKLTQDALETTGYYKDLIKFQNDIENNIYAWIDENGVKHPRYDISPAEWVKELDEDGWLNSSDAEYETAKRWFMQKTGKNLDDYTK